MKNKKIISLNATYTPDYCESLALAYGNNMMSEGGSKEIDAFLKGTNIKGKNVLDFGSGLGGLVFHMAQHYDATVTGLEINPEMLSIARQNTPENIKNKVSFVLSEGDFLPFPDEYFDVVVSKGVIVHLNEDQRLEVFKEFYRILKKEGTIVIVDWLSPTQGVWSNEIKELIEDESLPLYPYSLENYCLMLEKTGFGSITSQNRSPLYAGYNNNIVANLNSEPIKSQFIKKYGLETLKKHRDGYQKIATAHETGSLMTVKIIGRKI